MSQRIEIWYLRLFLLLNKLILLRLGCMFNNLEKFREVSWCVVGVLVEAEGGETCLTHYYVAKPFFICTKSTMVWPFTNELGKMWLSLNCLIFWDSEKGLREQMEMKHRWTLTLIFAYLFAYLVFPRLNRDLFSSVDNSDTKHFDNTVLVQAF